MASWQLKALAIVPKASGFLSLICSIMIVFNILSLPRVKQQQIYTRLVLAMSFFDILASLCTGLSTWPIPKESGVLYASGNIITCSMQGFMLTLSGVGTVLHNTSLAIYYWAVLVLKWNDRKIQQHLSIWLHGIPIIFPLVTASIGLFFKIYNNANLWCWIASVPSVCGGNTGVECNRGEHAELFRWIAFYGPIWICIIFVTILMMFVFFNVWETEKASAKYTAQNKAIQYASNPVIITSTNDNKNHNASNPIIAQQQQQQRPKEHFDNDNDRSAVPKFASAKSVMASFKISRNSAIKRNDQQYQDMQLKLKLTRKVFWQSIFYVLAFYLTWVFPTILRLDQALKQPVPYYVLLTSTIFLPLQGFFNAFIYFRPRIEYWRKQRLQAARKQRETNQQISPVATGTTLAIGHNVNERDNQSTASEDDQVGISLEMESNPAYLLSLATGKSVPDSRKTNNIKGLIGGNNVLKELENKSVIRIQGTTEMIQDTTVIYNQLFESDEQPTFDAIYQLPPPPSSSSSDKPKRGLFMLYGDLCHIYKASMESSHAWNQSKTTEYRSRIKNELEGLTTILIVDLRSHTEHGQQQWEEFIEPLVSTGDVKVIEIINNNET